MDSGAGRAYSLATALVVLAGAALRLAQPDLTLFKFDEAAAAEQVVTMLRTHVLVTAGGESSVGALFPPLFEYLMVPPFLRGTSPILAVCYVALLNVAALLGGAVLVARYAGARAALLSTLLWSLGTFAVLDSRKVWPPYVMAPLVILTLWGLLALVVERRRWGAALALAGWLWLLQLHPSAALLAPVLLIGLLAGWKALRPLPLLAGLAAGLLPLLPYALAEARQGWPDLLRFLQAARQPARFSWDALGLAVQNTNGFGASQLEITPLQAFLHPPWLAPTLAPAGLVLLTIGVIAAAVAATRGLVRGGWSGPNWKAGEARPAVYWLPLLWLLAPIALALRHGMPLYAHYFTMLLPVSFIVMALGLDTLCRLGAVVSRVVLGTTTAYALLAALPLLAYLAYLRTPAAADLSYARYALAVAQAADRAAPSAPVVLPLGDGRDSVMVLSYLLADHHATAVTDQTVALLAAAPVQLVLGSRDGSVAGTLAPASSGATVFAFPPGLVVAPLRQADLAALLGAMHPLDVQLANGVAFQRWSATQPRPGLLRVTLVWRINWVASTADHDDEAIYVHLVQGTRTFAQRDDLRYPPARWQAGQTIYSWYDLPLPAGLAPGVYELRAGMYTRPAIVRVPRSGPRGPEDGEFSLGTLALPLTSGR